MATPFQPRLDEGRLNDLRQRLKRACDEAKARPNPVAPFESDKERFGMTHSRYQHLLHAWLDFLSEDRKSANSSRKGPDHDSWPAFQKKLDSFQHYQIDIEDIKLHYIHEKATPSTSTGQPVIPLLLLHGWPSSVVDFIETIKPLAHPGNAALPAFDVVVPSQTGYLWSSSPTVDGFGRGKGSGPQGDFLLRDEARILHSLMLSLGYKRYAIQAGDWGSALLRHMAAMYPFNVAAVHLNFSPSPPPLLTPPLVNLALRIVPSRVVSLGYALTPTFVSNFLYHIREYPRRLDRKTYTQEPTFKTILAHIFLGTPPPLSKQDRAKVQRTIDFMATGSAYAAMQGSRPSTLGLVLQSDPGALLAWIGEKLLQWTDEDPSDADICAVLTLYWTTDTLPSSLYNYRNRPPASGPESAATNSSLYLKQPFGFSDFPKEVSGGKKTSGDVAFARLADMNSLQIAPSPISWIKQTGNLKWYRQHTSGGHFCSMEKPVEYIDDVRDCFSAIWPDV